MYAFWTSQRHSLVPPTQVSWRLFASLVPPPNLLNMISSIYHSSSHQYHDFQYPRRRGIKDGSPLSPSLFILVYEAFHATLTREFPTARFFVYVDDIAVVTPDKATLRRVLHRTHELSMSLGFRINHSKTEIYRWAPRHKCASITWEGNRIKILAPVFKYLGHHLAHPNFLGRAQTELMSQVTSDLSRYQHLPLDAFERAQLLSLVLFPKWCYRSLFIPHDRMFYDIDQKARNFVTAAKGIEPRHNVTHITDPVNEGGLGLHQIYWTYRSHYISLLQCALRSPHSPLRELAAFPVSQSMAPIRDYVALLKQLGASTPVTLQQRVVP